MTNDPMHLALQIAEAMVLDMTRSERTSSAMRAVAEQTCLMMAATGSVVSAEQIARGLESRFEVWVPREVWVENPEGHVSWLPEREQKIKWDYWDRYRTWLTRRAGWKPQAVEALNECTRTTLSLLENPMRPGEWRVKGLTYGQVQSGKTANYTGLICKAVDAGYQVVIVLTGAHESLRHQTQARLDLEFLGFNSRFTRQRTAESTYIGVGNLNMKNPPLCLSITTRDKDFNANVLETTPVDPRRVRLLAVVKKHSQILGNLADWLGTFATEQPDGRRLITDHPLLLIDDEADYASVDTRRPGKGRTASDPDHDPSTINRCVRNLLNRFEKRAYVAYTATPFANIFVSDETNHPRFGDDLFPSSFMVAMSPPSNYCGPEVVFGLEDRSSDLTRDPLPVIRVVQDEAVWMPDKHDKYHVPPDAIRPSFTGPWIRSSSQRRCESSHRAGCPAQPQHDACPRDPVYAGPGSGRQTTGCLSQGDGQPLGRPRSQGYSSEEALRSVRRKTSIRRMTLAQRGDQAGIDGVPGSYGQMDALIPEVLTECAKGVKIINGEVADVLEYESATPTTVIAVGGDKLSRGLTLEGLTVSYYLRASRTYDTLMQMGRWFGYRSGYLDVTRLYTTRELMGSYVHVARANRELMDLVSFLSETNRRPSDVGLRVMDGFPHLKVTNAAKMRNTATISLSSAGQRPETLYMRTSEDAVAGNFECLEGLVDAIKECPELGPGFFRPGGKGFFRRSVPSSAVLAFLEGFAASPRVLQANPKLLIDYINSQNVQGELTNWTVAVTSGSSDRLFRLEGEEYKQVARKLVGGGEPIPGGTDFPVGVLVGPEHEATGLSVEQHRRALEETQREFAREGRKPQRPSGRAIRRNRDPGEGLLLVYPVDSAKVQGTGQKSPPLVGYAFSLPTSETARSVDYRVNEVYLRELEQMLSHVGDGLGEEE